MKHFIRQTLKTLMAHALPPSKLVIGGPRVFAYRRQDHTASETGDGAIALTFDDGPHPEYTPRLLDLLGEYRLRGTFFVIGQQAERYPRLIERIVDEGHALGNHSYSHSSEIMISDELFLDEVDSTRNLLESMTGRPCPLVRPPKGIVTRKRLLALWKAKQTVVLWNVDPRDYLMHGHDDAMAWCRKYRPRNGDVLLWHDSHPFVITALRHLMSSRDCTSFQRMHTVPLHDLPHLNVVNRNLIESRVLAHHP